MKKLLSILGAVGLSATASIAVVSCSSSVANNPTASYSDFQGWINQSKNNGQNAIIFIGGKQDSDSLSFLAAKQLYATNGKDKNYDPKHVTDTDNIKKVDDAFVSTTKTDKSINTQMYASFNPVPGKEADFNSNLGKKILGDKKDTKSLAMHTLLVDDASTFWTTGVGTQIIDGIAKNQVSDFVKWNYTTGTGKPLSDKELNKKVKDAQASMKTTLSGLNNKGPYFLEIRNGNIVGITTGYKNYITYNKDQKVLNANASTTLSLTQANQDIDDLVKALVNNVWLDEYNYISSNWTTSSQPSISAVNNTFSELSSSWKDISSLNSDVTKWPLDGSGTDNGGNTDDGGKTDGGATPPANQKVKSSYKFDQSTIIKNS